MVVYQALNSREGDCELSLMWISTSWEGYSKRGRGDLAEVGGVGKVRGGGEVVRRDAG